MTRRNIIIAIVSILAVLLVAGGAYWFLSGKTTPAAPGSGSFFPGESSGTSSGTTGTSQSSETPATSIYIPGSGAPLPRLYELHKNPVAGVGFSETGKGVLYSLSARYIERSLGNIFETPLATLAESRISNETHQGVAEAFWGNNGQSVVIRFIDKQIDDLIKTHILNLSTPTLSLGTSTSAVGTASAFVKSEEIFLPDNIPFLSIAGDNSNKLFYLQNLGSVAGLVTDFKNKVATNIFSSVFTEWLPQFPNQKLVTVTTKPSASIPGHLFFLNLTTKAVTKVLGGINGLTTLTSPDGKFVLYSETKDGVPQLSVFDTIKKQSSQLPPRTLPEKCVWAQAKNPVVYCAVPQSLPQGVYPDQWYQGVVSFSDALWQIDVSTQNAQKIMTPDNLGAPALDMTNLSLSSDGSYLLFINKTSGTPWVYRLSDSLSQTINHSASSTTAPSIASPSPITPDMQLIK